MGVAPAAPPRDGTANAPALLASVAPLQSRQLHTRTTADGERVSLLAIGTPEVIQRVPVLS